MERQYRNVLVLSGCQATLQTVGTTMIAVTGLAGFALASDKALATLPLPFRVLATIATAWLVWQRRAARESGRAKDGAAAVAPNPR